MSMGRTCIAAFLVVLVAQPARADLPTPVLTSVAPTYNAVVSAPVDQLRFDYAQDVHLIKVQMVQFLGTRREIYTLFQANGAYLLGKSFVFPLQQPIIRAGTYRIEVMAQPTDNGQSLSTTYEFTIPDPAAETAAPSAE